MIMPKRFDLLVFDWDGTLMDSTAVIAGAIRDACADLGLPVPSPEEARHIIGLGLTQAIALLQPDLPQDRYPALIARYRERFLARDQDILLFDGVAQTIPRLHNAGHWVTVATGKNRNGLDRALDQSGLRSWFHATRCAEESFSKPHPAMLHELMELLDVSPERTLMIGDTSHDLQMANNAGVAAVAVSYGAHDVDELRDYRPLHVVHSFGELADWLEVQA